MKTIDCRGLACPTPVLKAKESIEKENLTELTVTVDNEAAKQNVSRFLESQHYKVSTSKKDSDFIIMGRKTGDSGCDISSPQEPDPEKQKIMVMVTTNLIGHGDDELGSKLMVSFLSTLKEMGDDLWRLVFINNGVKLTVEGSNMLAALKEIEDQGINILVCGTCLTHFDLLDKKRVGETTNIINI